ncbi:hypothetical protein LCGC14_2639370, partial [marine sediment metagenome]
AEIGRLCSVDDKTVAKVAEDLTVAGKLNRPTKLKARRKSGKVIKSDAKKSRSEIRTKGGQTEEKQGLKKTKTGPKSQLDIDRVDVRMAIELIKDIAMSGADHVKNTGDFEFKKDFQYCSDWFAEAANACDAKAA